MSSDMHSALRAEPAGQHKAGVAACEVWGRGQLQFVGKVHGFFAGTAGMIAVVERSDGWLMELELGALKMIVPDAPVLSAIPGNWITDPDSIPPVVIDECRRAISREFGNNGTDGYYKRILKTVFAAIVDRASATKQE